MDNINSIFILKDINFISSLININYPIFFKIDQNNNKIEIINYAHIILDIKLFKIESIIEEKFCLNGKTFLKYLNIFKKNSINLIKIEFSLDSVIIFSNENNIEIKIIIPIFHPPINQLINQSIIEENLPNIFRVILSKNDLEKISKFLITKSFKSFEKLIFNTFDNKLFLIKEFQGHKRKLLITNAELLEFNEITYSISDKFFRIFQMDFISKVLLSFNEIFLSFEILFNTFDETYFQWKEMRFLD